MITNHYLSKDPSDLPKTLDKVAIVCKNKDDGKEYSFFGLFYICWYVFGIDADYTIPLPSNFEVYYWREIQNTKEDTLYKG